MKPIIFTISVIFYATLQLNLVTTFAESEECFRAAVLEHVQQGQTPQQQIKDIKTLIQSNLNVYEDNIKQAVQYGAKIIVFPEYGIFFGVHNRTYLYNFVEEITDPKVVTNYIPCDNPEQYNASRHIQYSLSCLAKHYNIYIAADMGEQIHCKQSDKKCPRDNQYLYNTAVLFDNNGKLLAKYPKLNPFAAENNYFDTPEPELIAIQTPFGTLGMQICFDMIFRLPGVEAIEKLNISTMLFPTWWFDELPFLAAAQYQYSWAITNKVNLLASNIHLPEVGSIGSGIYSGDKGDICATNIPDGNAKLVIAELPISGKSSAKCSSLCTTIEHKDNAVNSRQNRVYIHQNMNMSNTNQVLLTKQTDSVPLCHNKTCCQLNYSLNGAQFSDNENYYLIVSQRNDVRWCEQFCGLVRCDPNGKGECKTFEWRNLHTTFKDASLSGNFSTKYVYPSVITSDNVIIARSEWQFSINDNLKTDLKLDNFNKSLQTFGLYGRCYDYDPPSATSSAMSSMVNAVSCYSVLLAIIIFKLLVAKLYK